MYGTNPITPDLIQHLLHLYNYAQKRARAAHTVMDVPAVNRFLAVSRAADTLRHLLEEEVHGLEGAL